tara:strand:+ start:5850 stop:7010 length:1161 start_codon:yes stop_codon:yes gene_type:complete
MSRFRETIGSLELGETADPAKIYEYGLYNPTEFDAFVGTDDADRNDTFETLNGGLSKNNFSPEAAGDLTSECFKIGTFARGYFYGFNFPDRYHEAQFDQDPVKLRNDENISPKRYFVGSYSLSANVFVPYPSITYISYQGFFCGEGLKKESDVREGIDNTHKYKGNRFVHHLYVDDQKIPTMVSTAPCSKRYDSGPIQALPKEYRWRWQNRTKLVWLDKGYHKVELFVQGLLPIYSGLLPSESEASPNKLQHKCGSISLVCMKAPSYSSEGAFTPRWWWMDIGGTAEDTFGYDDDGAILTLPPDMPVLPLDGDDDSEDLTILTPEYQVTSPRVGLGLGGLSGGEDSIWTPLDMGDSSPDARSGRAPDPYSPTEVVLADEVIRTESD